MTWSSEAVISIKGNLKGMSVTQARIYPVTALMPTRREKNLK